jgi:hypothetical protein
MGAITLNGSAIPEFLKAMPRWLLWRAISDGNGGYTKKPCSYRGGSGSTTDANTWATYDDVISAMARTPGAWDGVGVVLGALGDGLHKCGIDLDACIDPDGTVADWAQAILAVIRTYTETSPSGTGLKLFFRCGVEDAIAIKETIGIAANSWGCRRTIGSDGANHGPAIEVYLGPGRFFTVTGDQWAAAPDEIAIVDRCTLEAFAKLVPSSGAGCSGAANGEATDEAVGRVDWPEVERRILQKAAFHPSLARRWRGDWSGLRDSSGSGKAMSLGSILKRLEFTKSETAEALRQHPDTSDWMLNKGEVNNHREFGRIWDHAHSTNSTNGSSSPSDDQAYGGHDIEAIIAEFNEQYMVVSEAGKVVVYEPRQDPSLSASTSSAMRLRISNGCTWTRGFWWVRNISRRPTSGFAHRRAVPTSAASYSIPPLHRPNPES